MKPVAGMAPPQVPGSYFLAGTFTASIAWMMPLLEVMSRPVMIALPMRSLSPSFVTAAVWPCIILGAVSFSTSTAGTRPGITWYFSTEINSALFSGFSQFSRVPSGNFLNAASVGAKKV